MVASTPVFLVATASLLSIIPEGRAFSPLFAPSTLPSLNFHPTTYRHRHTPRILIQLSSQRDDGDDDGDENSEADDEDPLLQSSLSDVDITRAASTLDKLLLGDDDSDPTYSSERTRILNLEREIQLLSRLDPDHPLNRIDDDGADEQGIQNVLRTTQEEALDKLWALWYGERGPLNERKLRLYEERLMDVRVSSAWPEVLDHYLGLVYEHCGVGVDESEGVGEKRRLEDVDFDQLDLGKWIEPANRLATLLFLMGRLAESKAWCERILAEKPWHVGALSGIVVVCLKLNDEESAKTWAMKALPGVSPQTRRLRSEWVKTNVNLAKRKLEELEDDLRKKVVARAEVSVETTNRAMMDSVGFDDSAWQ
mmetsp:Transcript_23956/g.49619  ORF Transcript_23956/g.49619 Transcript_23956/m.49619 type:complete len:367 (-) Transcript_23956:68-1168(-)